MQNCVLPLVFRSQLPRRERTYKNPLKIFAKQLTHTSMDIAVAVSLGIEETRNECLISVQKQEMRASGRRGGRKRGLLGEQGGC